MLRRKHPSQEQQEVGRSMHQQDQQPRRMMEGGASHAPQAAAAGGGGALHGLEQAAAAVEKGGPGVACARSRVLQFLSRQLVKTPQAPWRPRPRVGKAEDLQHHGLE